MPSTRLTSKHTNKSIEQRQEASKEVRSAMYYLVQILHHVQRLLLNLLIYLYILFCLQHLLLYAEYQVLIDSTVDSFSPCFSGNLEFFNVLYFKKIGVKYRYRVVRSVQPFLGDMLGTGTQSRYSPRSLTG